MCIIDLWTRPCIHGAALTKPQAIKLTYSSRVLFEKLIVAQVIKRNFPHLLWNLKIHYCVHKSPPMVPILCQMKPIHILISHSIKIYYPPIYVQVSEWSLPFRFSDQKILCAFLISPFPSTTLIIYYIGLGLQLKRCRFFRSSDTFYELSMKVADRPRDLSRSSTGVVTSNPIRGTYVYSRLSMLCCPAALRMAHHPSKESYGMCQHIHNFRSISELEQTIRLKKKKKK
jgi:hypothetical protein